MHDIRVSIHWKVIKIARPLHCFWQMLLGRATLAAFSSVNLFVLHLQTMEKSFDDGENVHRLRENQCTWPSKLVSLSRMDVNRGHFPIHSMSNSLSSDKVSSRTREQNSRRISSSDGSGMLFLPGSFAFLDLCCCLLAAVRGRDGYVLNVVVIASSMLTSTAALPCRSAQRHRNQGG